MKKYSLAGVMFENLTTNTAVCRSAFINMEPRVCLHREPRAWLRALILMIHISHFISEKEARQRHNQLPPLDNFAASPTLPTPALPSRQLAEQMCLPGYLQQAGPRIILTFPPKSLGQTTFNYLCVMERKTAQKADTMMLLMHVVVFLSWLLAWKLFPLEVYTQKCGYRSWIIIYFFTSLFASIHCVVIRI